MVGGNHCYQHFCGSMVWSRSLIQTDPGAGCINTPPNQNGFGTHHMKYIALLLYILIKLIVLNTYSSTYNIYIYTYTYGTNYPQHHPASPKCPGCTNSMALQSGKLRLPNWLMSTHWLIWRQNHTFFTIALQPRMNMSWQMSGDQWRYCNLTTPF